MSKFIPAKSASPDERLSELLCALIGDENPKVLFATPMDGGFEVSDIDPEEEGCYRVDLVLIGTEGKTSLVSVEQPVGSAPSIYLVRDGKAELDEIMTETASYRRKRD